MFSFEKFSQNLLHSSKLHYYTVQFTFGKW